MQAPRLLLAFAFITMLISAPAAWAQVPNPDAPQCSALAQEDFTAVADAPTQITDAHAVAALASRPAHCRVVGYVAPNVGIEIWLPLSNWNHKFLEIGCAGTCGATLNSSGLLGCDRALVQGYACIASDMGHHGDIRDTLWAFHNPQALIDFSYRATHVVALAGKAITERFYGSAPTRSYFTGCSCGGHQGLTEAQQFPWDFDGLVIGAPVPDETANAMYALWNSRALETETGEPLFNPAAIELLHDAALAKCDNDDGLKDGIISNPRACHFDAATLLCKSGESTHCLTSAQVRAAVQIYAGAMTSDGRTKLAFGPMPGSERSIFQSPGRQAARFQRDSFRFLAFASDPGPNWQTRDFDFGRDYQRLSTILSATNPDLRQFKAHGGKIILYQGWADPSAPPQATLDYYEMVQRAMGGRAATADFLRLFMIPGMAHCSGGAGANNFDYLNYLDDWVDKGRAPAKIVGAHVDLDAFITTHADEMATDDDRFQADMAAFLRNPANATFTRPVFPYPAFAKYKGSGDPNSPENFLPSER